MPPKNILLNTTSVESKIRQGKCYLQSVRFTCK